MKALTAKETQSWCEQMNGGLMQPTLKKVTILMTILVGTFLVGGGLWYERSSKIPGAINLSDVKDRLAVPEEVDSVHLRTGAVPDRDRRRLLDGSFDTIDRMQGISENCKDIFYSSFENDSEKTPREAQIRFADPRQPAQFGDSLIPNAPFRQLAFAGQNRKNCFIFYEHGGNAYPSYCLAVMDLTGRRTVWVGEIRKAARDIVELRYFLATRQFADTIGPAC